MPGSPGKNYLGSSSITFMGITDAPTLVALACCEALALVNDLGISRVLVSSDCAPVVRNIEAHAGNYKRDSG